MHIFFYFTLLTTGRPWPIPMAYPRFCPYPKFYQTKCTRYLGIVLGGLYLHSAICFVKPNAFAQNWQAGIIGNNVKSVDEYLKIIKAQHLGDRIMHIIHIFFEDHAYFTPQI